MADAADRLVACLAGDPSRAALCCDFDGTLTPIVDDPGTTTLSARGRTLLADLAGALGAVAVVSGRPAAFLGARVDVPGVRLLGLYGLEEWRDGAATPRPEAAAWAQVVADVRSRLRGLVGHLEGVAVEDKGLSVAVHWRGAADRAGAEAEVAVLAERLARETGLAREPGKLVEELRPPVDWDKGAAVRAVVADAGLDRVAYLGDDRGDLPALRAASALGGVAIAVTHGDETPTELLDAADAVVEGHAGALAALRVLRDALST